MIIESFNNTYDFNNCDFDYARFLNNTNYEILETIEYDLRVPKLYPIISLYSIIDKLSQSNINTNNGNIDLIYNNNNINGRISLTKLRILDYLLGRQRETNILKKRIFPNNLEYIIGKGIIRDKEQNTLLCFCFDITKVNFTTNKILNDGIYLMLDIQKLLTSEHKQLFSILNSKGSVINNCIEENIDIIYTGKIDRKLFTVFDKEFISITDRKAYLQEKVKLLLQEDLQNVVI